MDQNKLKRVVSKKVSCDKCGRMVQYSELRREQGTQNLYCFYCHFNIKVPVGERTLP